MVKRNSPNEKEIVRTTSRYSSSCWMYNVHFKKEKKITTGLFGKGDIVTLVTPIDSSAPKGRMILPQMQVLREILDVGAYSIVTQGITENILSKSPILI